MEEIQGISLLDSLEIREWHHIEDASVLKRIDTSFTSDSIYGVRRDLFTLTLEAVESETGIEKVYAVDLDESPIDHGFVALTDDQICGFIGVRFEEWNRRLRIQHFYVDRASRGKGIGRRLIEAALKHAQSIGAVTLWAETSNLNYPGIEAYKKLGFVICGFDLSLYQGTPSADEFAVFLSQEVV